MGNLNNAINAVSDKEAVQFKTAIINELSRRLYNALEESRSSVANETFNNTEDMHFVEEDNIEEQITNEAVVDYKYMNGKLHKRIDKKFWKPETRNMEFKKVGSTTYYRIDKASWLPLRKGMNFIESTEVDGGDLQEDEWGGGFQTSADAHRGVQAGMKTDMQRERVQKLKLIVQVIRGEISKQKFKKLTGISYDDLMNPNRKNWYINQVNRMSKKALTPMNPAAPASTVSSSYEPDGGDIQESSFAVRVKTREGEEAGDRIRFSSKKDAQDYANMEKKAVAKQITSKGKKPQDIVSWKIVDSLERPTHSFSNGKLTPIKEDLDIQEKVDIDGRTSMYRNTVARIEQARKMRTEKTNKSSTEIEEDNEKFNGLYDDGSGRGARIPKPLDINPNRFAHITKESIDINEYDEAVTMKGGKYTMKEEELSPKQKEYRKFFDAALNKFKAKSPADLDDAKKKEFFNYVKQNWKG